MRQPRFGVSPVRRLGVAPNSGPVPRYILPAGAVADHSKRPFSGRDADRNVPLGAHTGIGFSGISESEVTAALRDLVFGFHAKMAGGKAVWFEKSGLDVFHLRELADLFGGNAKFIGMLRHPLGVIASNLDLARQMEHFPPEMQP